MRLPCLSTNSTSDRFTSSLSLHFCSVAQFLKGQAEKYMQKQPDQQQGGQQQGGMPQQGGATPQQGELPHVARP